ncbi:MAG TPA: YjjG family noncanonical pyrimidine nucleotidase [Ohtaekwangia sp.]
MKYKCIFFDLDHTLWDYETNSKETLAELYDQYALQQKGVTSVVDFQNRFREVNTRLWDLFDRGEIKSEVIREQRFKQILEPFGAYQSKLCEDISVDYLNTCPTKGTLMPHALDTLHYLKEKYTLTIITNGFEEIQNLKLTAGNLHPFFDHIVTSQRAGHRKPSREIFEFALKHNTSECHEAIMIGDNLVTDIGGAMNASIDAVFFNPERFSHTVSVHHEINSLDELRRIL